MRIAFSPLRTQRPSSSHAAEAGDVGGVRALEGDQQRVAERVAVEARAGAQPALPALAREQGAGRVAELVELRAAASVALLGSERSA